MGKNIVLCLDGTGNQLQAKGNTNVLGLYEMLDLSDPTRQVAFYDPGVGTFSAPGALTPMARWCTRILGLAVGYGLRANLAEAYTYLMQTYEPGDRIYIFGFSRGAYTARALCGLLNRPGLMRRGSENLVSYAVKVYARNRFKRKDWHRLGKFSEVFAIGSNGNRVAPVEFLGMWDTVNAAGIIWWRRTWPWTRKLPNVKTACHAVSIDEKRRPYREYLVFPEDGVPELHEVWFAGVHSDVGGRFDPPGAPSLTNITMKWMADRAIAAGVLIRPTSYQEYCSVTRTDALAKVHRMGWIWALLTYRKRTICPAGASIHESVAVRMSEFPSYRPKGITGPIRDDPDWLVPVLTTTPRHPPVSA